MAKVKKNRKRNRASNAIINANRRQKAFDELSEEEKLALDVVNEDSDVTEAQEKIKEMEKEIQTAREELKTEIQEAKKASKDLMKELMKETKAEIAQMRKEAKADALNLVKEAKERIKNAQK